MAQPLEEHYHNSIVTYWMDITPYLYQQNYIARRWELLHLPQAKNKKVNMNILVACGIAKGCLLPFAYANSFLLNLQQNIKQI